MEFFSATKKNEILSFASKWLEPENIILSNVRRLRGQKLHGFPHMQIITQNKYINIIGHGSHTKGRTYMGGRNRERKVNLKL
jgi:hypothetical protein